MVISSAVVIIVPAEAINANAGGIITNAGSIIIRQTAIFTSQTARFISQTARFINRTARFRSQTARFTSRTARFISQTARFINQTASFISQTASDKEEIKEKRLTYVDLLQEIEKEIRDISHDLHSDIFNGAFNYISLLNNLINEQNELKVTHFLIKIDSTVAWENIIGLVKITIYRIVQEAIQNVIKHSNAKVCRIEISNVGNKELYLTIEDNGVGFDSNKKENEGIGLKNMKERAKTLNSKLNVTSDLGKGTKIEVVFTI